MPGTVTHKNQPAIHEVHGLVPEAGTSTPYTVSTVLWPDQVSLWIMNRLKGSTLHVCCGKSQLGHCRLDLYEAKVDVRADAARLPFADQSWDTVLCDPPYTGRFQWNHDMLSELARVAHRRIIFQHWFLPVDYQGRYKKSWAFRLVEVAVWQGKTYFGRAQLLTVFDRAQERLL